MKLRALLAFTMFALARLAVAQPADAYASALGDMINRYRAANGLPALELSADLSRLAAEHSADMAKQRSMSHAGFQQRFRRSGSSMCVENVGWNYHRPAAQLEAWRDSPVHDRNLRNAKVARMGIGNVSDYVTFIACS